MIAFCFITPIPDRVTGLSSHTDSLVAAVAARCANDRILFLSNAQRHILSRLTACTNIEFVAVPHVRRVPYKIYALLAHTYASWIALRRGCIAHVNTTASAALIPFVKQYFTFHDLYDADPQFRRLSTTLYAKLTWTYFGIVSTGILCISDATHREAAALLPHATPKMRVIKEGCKFSDADVSTANTVGARPMFAFVANVERTKNVECLLQALAQAERDGHHVRVEWIGWDSNRIVEQWLRQNGPLSNFVIRGAVSDEVLQQTYRNAAALIVPSLKEGFCLPAVEAQYFGRPVIASDIPTLREVVGDGGLFFDPKQPKELLDRMVALADEQLLGDLSVKAIVNARKYSWSKAASDLLSFIGERQSHSGVTRRALRIGLALASRLIRQL